MKRTMKRTGVGGSEPGMMGLKKRMRRHAWPAFGLLAGGVFGGALLGCPREHESSPTVAAAADTAAVAEAPHLLPVLDDPSTVELMPGVGIGPVRLGMHRAELEALGLPIREIYEGLEVGPYRVVLDAGAVRLVEVGLADVPDGIRAGRALWAPEERSIERLAADLEGCGPRVDATGASVIECSGVRVLAAGPPGIIELQVMAP